MASTDDTVAAIRRFNRFYTRAIGVLERAFLGGPYTLPETRVLWEVAQRDGVTPSSIAGALGLDAGYLSRMIARLERDGLVVRRPSPSDGRSVRLQLTAEGRSRFAAADARQVEAVEALIAPLGGGERSRLVDALDEVRGLLAPHASAGQVILRDPQPGDMGWVTERHGVIYGREYGWGAGIEAVTARIVGEFLERGDTARERCWIAERDGQRLGCVFLVKETEEVARLRLLLLEPAARGVGLGRRLVDACLLFARAAGYREVVLWTHAVLTAARRIYAEAGFEIERTWVHDGFGAEEISETWRLKL